MSRLWFAMLAFGLTAMVALAPAARAADNTANPDAVRAVEAGERSQANAAWWGFDEEDATQPLQEAIDAGAETLIVPDMGSPWYVEPIELTQDGQTIVFEEGVVIEAKAGAFHDRRASLFTAESVEDLTLHGYGATWRMRIDDYQSDAYEPSGWRHGLALLSARNVEIAGLRIEDTGGDGIYIGRAGVYDERDVRESGHCENITIRDVVCDNNHRQGISVISVRGLLIEDCVLMNTDGTPPAAGIDFEPNNPTDVLVDCVLRNTHFRGNRRGVFIYLRALNDTSEPVSILVENCHIAQESVGLDVAAVRDRAPQGTIEFRNVVVDGVNSRIRDKSPNGVDVILTECTFIDGHVNFHASLPIASSVGGVTFDDCLFLYNRDHPVIRGFLRFDEDEAELIEAYEGVKNVTGHIRVANPYGSRIEWDVPTTDVDIQVTPTAR